jgi:antitoxin component HigA of HigAB toxin-antitoxin module
MRTLTPIEYQTALREVLNLMDTDPSPDTPDGHRMLQLVDEIEAYEERMYPMVRVLPVLNKFSDR